MGGRSSKEEKSSSDTIVDTTSGECVVAAAACGPRCTVAGTSRLLPLFPVRAGSAAVL